MRTVPSYISTRLAKNIQTRANNSAPSSRIWISRPSTVLVDDRLLERQTILNASVSDVSVAVCHPKKRKSNTAIFMAYISDGVARVVSAKHKLRMDAHVWVDTGFEAAATAVSIAFDGTMPKVYGSEVEFVTETTPWIFWVNDSKLYATKLYSDEDPIVLAETNCTDVSAIRAMWSSVGGFDFGLVVFFILNGTLYYRQLIDGEWMDAEVVSFGPSGVKWQEVAAFRTWDYRIGVQAKTTDGTVYELFTQFMGVGKQNVEHLDMNVIADLDLVKIEEWVPSNSEHAITVTGVESGAPYGGLYSTLPPNLVDAYNIDDGNGDWGKKLVIVSDVHLRAGEIEKYASSFAITDSMGRSFAAYSAELSVEDGLTVVLSFKDFNAAKGDCIISYTPGAAITLANTVMEYTELAFTPVHLVPPDIPVPEATDIWNLDSRGNNIAIKFTEAIIENPAGNEDNFDVIFDEYDRVPEGTLSSKTRHGTGVKMYASYEEPIDMSSGEFDRTSLVAGTIQLSPEGGV